ncbi:hypothetical protein [Terriglobus roseus]|uniref:Uncharacterized protein n=1 Tax=Terriglobus roseus TaxID=392734 RepID=A0A1H4PFL8_9BACT|nr:hypothetical protein [Terriglobus roseus]SEC06078.1 hypothetical protein SAMN05443244_2544 [Terriglobus roseus]
MHEVHPADHPIHGVRDFLLHLFTITVGLLIALGLENIAEYVHHRHLVHEARENLHHEIEDNRKDLKDVLEAIPKEQARYKDLLTYLQARAEGRPSEIHKVMIGVEMITPQDASWQTANATGALSFMPYSEVQRYATAYQLQKKLDALQEAAIQPVILLIATVGGGDPEKLSKEDLAGAIPQVRQVAAHLESVREIGADLDKRYADALKGE